MSQSGSTDLRMITIWQPWASLMACGAKLVETRHWKTRYRGPLAIHSAKRFGQDQREACMEPMFSSALRKGGATKLCDLPLGCILAVVDLIECRATDGKLIATDDDWPPGGSEEREFGNFGPGRYGWITDNLRRLSDPVSWKGQQGLYTIPWSAVRGALP